MSEQLDRIRRMMEAGLIRLEKTESSECLIQIRLANVAITLRKTRVEVSLRYWNKGRLARDILARVGDGADCVLAIGDDATDETGVVWELVEQVEQIVGIGKGLFLVFKPITGLYHNLK
jgi:trehalose-6-phosphatase